MAPYVLFHFHEEQDHPEHHELLIDILQNEAVRRGFSFQVGGSFGFRSHRFEIVGAHKVPDLKTEQHGLLKVAMGRRQGAARDEVIRLLEEIAALPDFGPGREV